jgi:hypothetical protein
MNYIRLQNLTNTYPQPGNYIPFKSGDSALFGIYQETNKIDFKISDFSEVIPVSGVSTRFIFAVTYDKTLSQIVDSDDNVIDTKLDINNLKQKSTSGSTDTKLDKFIKESNSSKRKKKKGLLGRIAKAAVDALAGNLINSVRGTGDAIKNTGNAINAVSFGIRRKEIRKQRNSKLSNDNNILSKSAVKAGTNPLTGEFSNMGDTNIGRKNQKRSKIFGNNFSRVENSTAISKKSELIADDNLSKLRIFSDLKIENKDDIETKLFCSIAYLENLTDSKNSGNPYFVNFSLKPEYMVEVNAIPLLELMDSFSDSELTNGVLMKRNNYIVDGNFDYEKLVKYVDWVVSKPTLSEIDTNGVIPANLLCEYEKGTFDKKTGKWDTSVIQKSNTTAAEDDTESNNTNNNSSQFPPVGRVGSYTGEIFDLDGEFYAWTGDVWRPTSPRNQNGGGSGGASGNFGGSGNNDNSSGNGDDGRDRRGML